MDDPNKPVENRRPDGTFGPGNNANPNGRPAGRSMKEFWKKRFAGMTDEQIEQWAKDNKVSPDLIWQMAEGRPQQDVTSDGEPLNVVLVKFLDGKQPDNNRDTGGVQEAV